MSVFFLFQVEEVFFFLCSWSFVRLGSVHSSNVNGGKEWESKSCSLDRRPCSVSQCGIRCHAWSCHVDRIPVLDLKAGGSAVGRFVCGCWLSWTWALHHTLQSSRRGLKAASDSLSSTLFPVGPFTHTHTLSYPLMWRHLNGLCLMQHPDHISIKLSMAFLQDVMYPLEHTTGLNLPQLRFSKYCACMEKKIAVFMTVVWLYMIKALRNNLANW